jgi:hypothetical protein
MAGLHPTFAGILAAHGAPMPMHSAGVTLNQIRNALIECGWEPSAIDWQSADGRHSLTLQGADGGTYRLTISPESGQ